MGEGKGGRMGFVMDRDVGVGCRGLLWARGMWEEEGDVWGGDVGLVSDGRGGVGK